MASALDVTRLVAQRLLEGSASPLDLQRLFLNLRELARRNKLSEYNVVCEIGDFVAHAHLRDRGVAVEWVRDMHEAFNLLMSVTLNKTCSIARTSSALRANYRMGMRRKLGRERENLRKQAKLNLNGLLAKKPSFDGRRFRTELAVTHAEVDLLKALTSFTIDCISNHEDIIVKTLKLMHHLGITKYSDRSIISDDQSKQIGIYIISTMHRIDLLDQSSGELFPINISVSDENVYISCSIGTSSDDGPMLGMVVPFYNPGLKTSDCFEENFNWAELRDAPIEVSRNGRIIPMKSASLEAQ